MQHLFCHTDTSLKGTSVMVDISHVATGTCKSIIIDYSILFYGQPVTPTSTAAFIEPGSKKRQIEEKDSGVLIAAAVGSTLLAGAVFLILLICWRKRRAR